MSTGAVLAVHGHRGSETLARRAIPMDAAPRPSTRRRVTTTDVDEARAEVSRIFCPHRLEPVARQAAVQVKLRSASVGSIGLTYLSYGAPVHIDPGPLKDFFLVQVPLAGQARIRCGSDEIVSDPTLASVPHPDRYLDMEWGEGNPQIIFYVERAALELQLGRLLGRPGRPKLDLALGMHMADPRVQSWWRAVDLLREEIVSDSPMLDEPVATRELEQMIMNRLLLAQPHNFTDALQATSAPQSRAVAKARTLMENHACEALTVADIAEAVGVSMRALQEGFRRDLQTTPMEYLREVRMRNVRSSLMSADPGMTTVTELAHQCGFVHLGRFSVDYRKRFGESPSQTLINR